MYYYDKDSRQEVIVPTPFKFIVLDVLNVIGGFHKQSRSGVFSNEVRNLKEEKLVVRNREGVLLEGLYADFRDRMQSKGAKFGNSIYLSYQENGEWKLGNLNVVGAGFSSWVDFKKNRYLDSDPGAGIAEWTPETNGDTEYFAPVFKSWQVPAADLSVAAELDKTLQAYLSSRGSAVKEDAPADDPWTPPAQPVQQSFVASAPF